MATELVSMSRKEIDRLDVIRRVLERRLTQVKAAELLGLGPRQVGRLCAAYERRGPPGLVSRQRGKASNRRLPESLQARALELVRERYADFGPTLAGEKLRELHGVDVARETLRKWMAGAGIWLTRDKRREKAHQPRLSDNYISPSATMCCHLQWYLDVTAETLVHGLAQAIQKRGLPRALLTDNGSAMVALEVVEGLERLEILAHTTLPYSPEQNAKQEVFWGQVEGRLIAMLEGHADLTLALLTVVASPAPGPVLSNRGPAGVAF